MVVCPTRVGLSLDGGDGDWEVGTTDDNFHHLSFILTCFHFSSLVGAALSSTVCLAPSGGLALPGFAPSKP